MEVHLQHGMVDVEAHLLMHHQGLLDPHHGHLGLLGPLGLLEAPDHLAPGPHLEGLQVACSMGHHLSFLLGPHHHACMVAGFWPGEIGGMNENDCQPAGAENTQDQQCIDLVHFQ